MKGTRKGRRVFFDVKAGTDEEGSQMNNEARSLLKATYLKPLRDTENEMTPRKNSRLSQILDSHQAFEDKEMHHLKKAMEQANEMILQYFKGHDGESALGDQNGKLAVIFMPRNTLAVQLFDGISFAFFASTAIETVDAFSSSATKATFQTVFAAITSGLDGIIGSLSGGIIIDQMGISFL